MTFNSFTRILRNIVVFWPYSEVGRVNCFATFKEREEINHSTFGRRYEDYLQGYFWARPWVLDGAPKNSMERDFGAIIMEHKRGDVADVKAGAVNQRVFLNSVQLVEQEGLLLTEDEAAILNQTILMAFLKEIDSTYEHTIIPDIGPAYDAWLTPTHAALVEDADGIAGLHQKGVPLAKHIRNWDDIVIQQNFFGIEEMRSSMVELVVRTCDPPGVAFDYSQPDTPEALTYIVECD